MKKSLNFVLGLLFVGVVSSANAENLAYSVGAFESAPVKSCFIWKQGGALFLHRKDMKDGSFKEYFLVGDQVYAFTFLNFDDEKLFGTFDPHVMVTCNKLKRYKDAE